MNQHMNTRAVEGMLQIVLIITLMQIEKRSIQSFGAGDGILSAKAFGHRPSLHDR